MLQGSLALAAVRAFAIWLAVHPAAAHRWRRHLARRDASCLELSATMLDNAAWRKAVILGVAAVAVLLLSDRPDSSLVVLRHFLSRCGAGFSTISQYLCSSSTIVGMQALLCYASDSEAEVTIAMLRHPYSTAHLPVPSWRYQYQGCFKLYCHAAGLQVLLQAVLLAVQAAAAAAAATAAATAALV